MSRDLPRASTLHVAPRSALFGPGCVRKGDGTFNITELYFVLCGKLGVGSACTRLVGPGTFYSNVSRIHTLQYENESFFKQI